MKRTRNHSFPKTYTTAGAIYRAKKNFQEMFPDQSFITMKQDGKYILDKVTTEKQDEVKPKLSRVKQDEIPVPIFALHEDDDDEDLGYFDDDNF
jgi:hypothetical protein